METGAFRSDIGIGRTCCGTTCQRATRTVAASVVNMGLEEIQKQAKAS